MASTLPTLNYTTPEEFVNYYYEQLKADLGLYDLQISKVGFIGYILNLLGYTHFDLKQYYDSLFKEAFVGTAQDEESQYLHASTYGYIPTFATESTATGTIEFDMINWLPRRQPDVVRREVNVGYEYTSGTYSALNSTFEIESYQFIVDAFYKFIEVENNGSYYYYVEIITADGEKITLPSSSSLISAPLYTTTQCTEKEISFELKSYNFGSYETYYFDIDPGYYLSNLRVFVTEENSTVEEEYDIKYTKYLEKGNDKCVFLRKITSTSYIIEFGSGIRGKWISSAQIRLVIRSTIGTAGNLIDKTSTKIPISGSILAFDYMLSTSGEYVPITGSNPVITQQPLIDFDYSEGGLNPLSGEDLRDAIINYIQTRDNMISQQDFYNIAAQYYDDFKFLFKKFNVYDNIFHLCRSFRDHNQTILYTTNHNDPVMNLRATTLPGYTITAVAGITGTGSLTDGTYGYFVIAIDEWGRSTPSAVVTAVVDSSGAGENSVTITFDAVANAVTYRLFGRNSTFRDQYWEITDTGAMSYSYVDDGTAGTPSVEPTTYALTEIIYQPHFTINGRSFISPYVYKGNTRMNYYEGFIIKDVTRIEFAEINPANEILGTGFDVPTVYLTLEYDESTYETTIKLKSYQTISNLVFTISIYGDNINIVDEPMFCFPLSNNYFEYTYINASTYGIFEGEIQIEIKGGVSNSLVTNQYENFTIGAGTNTLKMKFNDDVGWTTITLTTGTPTAATLAADINASFPALAAVAAPYDIGDGQIRLKITPPTYSIVPPATIPLNGIVYIASSGSTCLTALGLTGDDTNPAVLNGSLAPEPIEYTYLGDTYVKIIPAIKFTCTTGKFYQLTDTSDQLKLMIYTSGTSSYVVNIPVIDHTTFVSDTDYYLDKIKNFMTTASFNANRMVTDNVQCRFLNSYLIESPIIESLFIQSGQVFSNASYTWLPPVIAILDTPPLLPENSSKYLVGSAPTGAFIGHTNDIATFTSPATWTFYTPTINDTFVLDNGTNIYYRWNGAAWVTIPSIELPLKMSIEIKVDKGYAQRNNIDIAAEKEAINLVVAEYLQKNFTGPNIVFYNSLIVDLIHNGRTYIKSVKVFVTDSASTPNEMDNGIEVKSDINVLAGLHNKIDIVRYTPPMFYWDIDNLNFVIYIE